MANLKPNHHISESGVRLERTVNRPLTRRLVQEWLITYTVYGGHAPKMGRLGFVGWENSKCVCQYLRQYCTEQSNIILAAHHIHIHPSHTRTPSYLYRNGRIPVAILPSPNRALPHLSLSCALLPSKQRRQHPLTTL
jgi:hypothetical protein